jgi:serine/threonine protein kinase
MVWPRAEVEPKSTCALSPWAVSRKYIRSVGVSLQDENCFRYCQPGGMLRLFILLVFFYLEN